MRFSATKPAFGREDALTVPCGRAAIGCETQLRPPILAACRRTAVRPDREPVPERVDAAAVAGHDPDAGDPDPPDAHADSPPSTENVCPVTYAACSESRKPTAVRDLVGAPQPPHRNPGREALAAVFGERVEHRRVDEPRRDRVDGDAEAGALDRERARERVEPPLGRGVDAVSRDPPQPRHRADEHDAAEARLHHRRNDRAHERQVGGEVRLDDLQPLGFREAEERALLSDARARDEMADRSDGRLGVGDEGGGIGSRRRRTTGTTGTPAGPASRWRW